MRKCKVWKEAVEAECPHCRTFSVYVDVGDAGDIVECCDCDELFELGKQG